MRVDPRPLDHFFHGTPLLLALDGLQDPGNAGAIVRAAEAFGATGVVFLKGSASPWNPKTLRASAGSLLRVPFAACDWEEFLAAVQRNAVTLFAAHPRAPQSAAAAPLHLPSAILIGNEGRGIPPDHEAHAQPIRIPTRHVESLNAALAAGILLYEASRQRQ
jgi:RNA methyltransferase, TrmH family